MPLYRETKSHELRSLKVTDCWKILLTVDAILINCFNLKCRKTVIPEKNSIFIYILFGALYSAMYTEFLWDL